jgi:DNA-3-methyladenine glycosylase
MRIIPASFYRSDDVESIASALLGKVLVTNHRGQVTSGRITETEAYKGVDDRACHAFGGRRTPRNEVMYAEGGHAYVYICYGIHFLFNVVTNRKDHPDAVLIRAVEPLEGVPLMLNRSDKPGLRPNLAAGPGNLTRALGITMDHNGLTLFGPRLHIADDGLRLNENDIIATPRIGVESAGADALRLYRYIIKGNNYVSGRRTDPQKA